MLQHLINPLLIAFTISTTFGVLVHDTQLDKMATISIAIPVTLATYAAVDIKSDAGHTHVERFGSLKQSPFRADTPRIQPRDDEQKYLSSKAGGAGGLDVTRLWPSV
jgi:hypothetical protein